MSLSKTSWKTAIASLLILILILAGTGCSPQEAPPQAPQSDTVIVNGEATVNGQDKPKEQTVDAPAPGDTTDKPDPDPQPTTGTLTVHLIDVGQGDAIFIQAPTQNVIIDAGDRGNTVVNYLKAQGISELDLVIATHGHADHIGGLINVFQSMLVKEVIDPGVVHTTKTFEDYLTLIDQKDIKFTEGRSGMSRDLGNGILMEILHPSSPSSNHLNDASIVAKVTFGNISFMLTGDAERASENQMLNRKYNLNSTILKVGHHGSRTSTTTPFLQAVDPQVAVIMCSKDNRYGHPHEETLQKLSQAGVDIYRTDIHGTIVITTDGQTYDINVKQPYQYHPQKVPEPEPDSAPTPSVSTPGGKININTASLEELQEITHIGPARAQDIIDLRPFNSLDGLTIISGIGPTRLQDIKDEGKAYVD